ncbi:MULTISPECIES: hypothetical protein [unclassified Paenibacillus]|uniref:hypothetical protein n=1 Tax=unclassified Paenibacillus TaxID=185978 RepID=UPI001115A099|nr:MULTISPECIES: hypothetical protein [unclassified Paenibacillus]QID16026.1 hypothetical protein CIC07_25170 [Paenibacillus sp. RUD330]
MELQAAGTASGSFFYCMESFPSRDELPAPKAWNVDLNGTEKEVEYPVVREKGTGRLGFPAGLTLLSTMFLVVIHRTIGAFDKYRGGGQSLGNATWSRYVKGTSTYTGNTITQKYGWAPHDSTTVVYSESKI